MDPFSIVGKIILDDGGATSELENISNEAMLTGNIFDNIIEKIKVFGDTLGTNFANQVQVAQLNLNILGQSIGNVVLPYFIETVSFFKTNMPQIQQFVSSAVSSISGLIKTIETIVDDANKLIELPEKVSKLKEGINKLQPTVGGSLVTDLKKAGSGFSDLAQKLGGGLLNGLKKAGSGFSDLSQKLGSGLLNGLKKAGSGFSDLAQKLGGGLLNGLKKTGSGFSDLTKKLGSSLLNGLKKVVSGFQSLFAMMAANPVSIVILAIVAGLVILYNKNAAFRNLVNDVWNGIKTFFAGLPAFFSGIGNSIKATATNLWNFLSTQMSKLISGVAAWFSQLPGKVGAGLLNTIAKIRAWGSGMYSAASSAVNHTVSGIVTWFSQLPGRIWSFLSTTLRNIGTWGGNMYSSASSAVGRVVSGIVKWFSSLPQNMLSIGKNIITGLWNGIMGAGNWIRDKVGGFCSGVVSWFKSALGIHSPSRVFADQVGKFMALGIGQGFTENMQSVSDKMMATVGAATSGLNIGVQAQMLPFAYTGQYTSAAQQTSANDMDAVVHKLDVLISVMQGLRLSVLWNGKEVGNLMTQYVGRNLESEAQALSYARGR